jgi:hypothetical protein
VTGPPLDLNDIVENFPPDIAAEFISMRGEYSTWFVYAPLSFFF